MGIDHHRGCGIFCSLRCRSCFLVSKTYRARCDRRRRFAGLRFCAVQCRGGPFHHLRNILVKDGSSIVLTTHYLEEAEALADRAAVLAKGRVIASGTVNEMRALVVRKRISCCTTLAVELVQAWPEVESVSRDQQRLRITASNAESVVRRLLAADQDLQELEVRSAGLAEAFTELTQEAAS